jgi:hypothetical protein
LSLTAANGASGGHALRAGLMWWPAALVFVVAYFTLLFRLHRGRVVAPRGREGY